MRTEAVFIAKLKYWQASSGYFDLESAPMLDLHDGMQASTASAEVFSTLMGRAEQRAG